MRKIQLQIASLFLMVCILFAGAVGALPLYNGEQNDGAHAGEEPLPDGDSSPGDGAPPHPPAHPDGESTDESGGVAEDDPPKEDVPVDEKPQPPKTAAYVRSKVDGLNIRSGPGTSFSVLGSLDRGDMLILLSREGSWYKTVYKNRTAYVSAGAAYTESYELPLSENDAVEKVIDEGVRLLGFPYVYGAIRLHDGKGNKLKDFNASKYDCSSLMQYIFYYGADVYLNMTTRTQVSQGSFVARKNIRRGDLIFFTNSTRYNKTGVERIGHVAMYLGGNYILHTATDHAVIEEISDQRWKYYIETRRMIL